MIATGFFHFGALTEKGEIDITATRRLVMAAKDRPFTFHRAFDVCRNPAESLEKLIETGCRRVLTSGQAPTAEQGIAMLSGILKSDVAIAANIAIMRAFTQVRKYLLAASTVSAELKELRARINLLETRQEEDLSTINDLSEDVRQDIDSLFIAISQLAERLEEKKEAPLSRIGFKQSKGND